MKRIALMTLAGTLILGSVLLSAQARAADVPIASGAMTKEVTGTVVVVNPQTRMLTIRQPDGVFQVINVPSEVQRLDEIRIEDTLTIAYVEAVAIDLQKGNAAAAAPGAVATREVDREGGRCRRAASKKPSRLSESSKRSTRRHPGSPSEVRKIRSQSTSAIRRCSRMSASETVSP